MPDAHTIIKDYQNVSRLVVNPTSKTIVDGSATTLFDVAIPNGGSAGGVFFYTVQTSDGTDQQVLTGMVSYGVVDKAGTKTLTITDDSGNAAKAVSAGTLTLSFTFVTGTGKATAKVTPTGSLTETTYLITITVLPLVGRVTLL